MEASGQSGLVLSPDTSDFALQIRLKPTIQSLDSGRLKDGCEVICPECAGLPGQEHQHQRRVVQVELF